MICLDCGRATWAQGIYIVGLDECQPEKCIKPQNGNSGQDEINVAGVSKADFSEEDTAERGLAERRGRKANTKAWQWVCQAF